MPRLDPFPAAPDGAPAPGDRTHAEDQLAQWRDALAGTAWGDVAADLADRPAGRALLLAIFGNSPFLTQCVHLDPGALHGVVTRGPAAVSADACARAEAAADAADRAGAMAELRHARRANALAVGLADIAGAWALDGVTEALSAFADAAVRGALGFLLNRAATRGELAPAPGDGAVAERCGYTVLAMGKLGARELNYSSDIDLVAVHDPERMPYTGRRDPDSFAVKLTRELTRMLEERTGDGFVARVDLRLRPDPSAMPLSVALGAAETYYESQGQNWERAAMIKARPCAGDPTLGRTLTKLLKPFVWRTHLDFWAIRDIHAMKRQIHAQRGGSTVAVAGHDIKLGRGGIREIEFYVQTQQLIWGGRDRRLRAPRTLDALSALALAEVVGDDDAAVLAAAYRELRRLEHRLQMMNDRQTQTLPEDPDELARFAVFAGYADADALSRTLLHHLRTVEDRYAALFEEAPSLAGPGNLVFTGNEIDPETVETLHRMGFADGQRVVTTVAAWHRGRYRATRSPRAREILTELVPTLVQALGRTADPDTALTRFDEFLAGLPAGVQLFATLHANPKLLDLLARIMGAAPHLAEHLRSRPQLLEAVLSPHFFDALPDRDALDADLAHVLGDAAALEDALDLIRRWARDRVFQVGVHLLEGLTDVDAASGCLTAVAEAALAALWPWVYAAFAEQHGELAGPGLAVLALGKLGGREMLVGSDLDLVLVAETSHAPDEPATGGRRPLEPGRYFARLAQRFINAISAPTAEGRLYEVDTRLRPHGDNGALVVSPDALARYYAEDAWTWELMALTRARPVLGDPELCRRLRGIVRDALARPRDPAATCAEVVRMRLRLDRQYPPAGAWDVKYRRGGLVDLEFLAQALHLCHAADHPNVLAGATGPAIAALGDAGVLDAERAATLAAAGQLLRQVQGMIRLLAGGHFHDDPAPDGPMARLAAACDAENADALRARLDAAAADVRQAYRACVVAPAHPALTADELAAADPEAGQEPS